MSASGVEQWILGFIAGNSNSAAAMFKEDPVGAAKVDARAIWGAVDRYCEQHPLESIAMASTEVFSDIVHKAHAANP